jgi:uncharacterized membrane protein YdjX (TVP38/TMEM64 family)
MPGKPPDIFWKLVSLAFWLLITIGLFYLINYPGLPALISRIGILGPGVIIFLFVITAPTPVTAEVLSLSSGVLFGPVVGSLTNLIGLLSSSLIEYFFGKKLFDPKQFADFQKKLPLGLGKLPIRSPYSRQILSLDRCQNC